MNHHKWMGRNFPTMYDQIVRSSHKHLIDLTKLDAINRLFCYYIQFDKLKGVNCFHLRPVICYFQ